MSAAYSVIYSPEALDDLKKNYAYIAFPLLVPETTERQVSRIRKEIRSLVFMLLRYARVKWEPWGSMEMHRLQLFNRIIPITIFRINFFWKYPSYFRIISKSFCGYPAYTRKFSNRQHIIDLLLVPV